MIKIPITIREDRQGMYAGLLVVSLVVFALCGITASSGTIAPWEKHLLLSIYNLPAGLRPLGIVATQFGSALFAVLLSIWLLTGREKSQHIGRLVLANSVITYGLVTLAKLVIGRPRPAELIQNLQQHDMVVSGLGFPSGHTALATVLSLGLLPFLPHKARWLPVAWIVLVGFSRIYLGVHAPLDIVGGFALGLAVVSAQRLLKVR